VNVPKMGKLDRMGVIESTISDAEDLSETAQSAIETFDEQRDACNDAVAEAQGYHEERDWESRDSSLEEAMNALDEMSSALDEIESQSEYVTVPEERMEELRKMVGEVREHLEAIL
jgi:DNA repair ATPase RecN